MIFIFLEGVKVTFIWGSFQVKSVQVFWVFFFCFQRNMNKMNWFVYQYVSMFSLSFHLYFYISLSLSLSLSIYIYIYIYILEFVNKSNTLVSDISDFVGSEYI